MQTCPQPFEQHFSFPGQSSSPLHNSTQMPGPVGLGHTPGFSSAAREFIENTLEICSPFLKLTLSPFFRRTKGEDRLLRSKAIVIKNVKKNQPD